MAGAPQPSASRKRRSAYLWGLRAETLAAVALRLKGWKLLARRYKAGNGESQYISSAPERLLAAHDFVVTAQRENAFRISARVYVNVEKGDRYPSRRREN